MNKKNILWATYTIDLKKPSIIYKSVIDFAIKKFWSNNINNIENNKHIIVLFRIVYINGIYNTIGNLQKLNKEDMNYYINYIIDILSIKSNDYKAEPINKIIINYGVRDGLAVIKNENITLRKNIHLKRYKHYNLPVTMNPLEYGELLHYDKALKMYLILIKPLLIAKIYIKKLVNNVEILKSGKLVLTYKDKFINEQSFERIIGYNHYVYIKENDIFILDLFKVEKPVRFIESKKVDKNINEKIITLDIETYDKMDESGNIKKLVYNLSWYDGSITKSYYITDYNNQNELLFKAIKDLCKAKYHSHKIYIHNFANFDAVFLIKELLNHGIVDPIIHKGRIVTVSLTYPSKNNSKFYTIYFRDSYQLLLSSLKKLAINFGVKTLKGVFPHRFINENNFDYNGPVPAFEYFDNITHDEYENYLKFYQGEWCIKKESIKYCAQDCISLHQIITLFNKLIFNKFKLNINKYPTLSSLSFGIFLTKYLKKVNIPMLTGQINKDIRISYTGGSTDMFIPQNIDNELVYSYDINSLYPSVMQNKNFPIGKPTYFEGDIRKYNNEAFGFFYCKVETPNNLLHPIIQLHIKTKSGLRTISPLGSFESMFFSEEIDNAIKLGYKFKILWGYTFKQGKIFHSFVRDMYNIRLKYSKDQAMNYIAKLLLNSLYGRMGMDDRFTYSSFISKDSYLEYEKKYSSKILDITDFGDNYLIEVEGDETRSMLEDRTEIHNINISIASAVTGYARVLMSEFKNNTNMKLYYTDTDSIFTDLNPSKLNKLISDIVDTKSLGKLKLETISSIAIFISPKVYYLRTIDCEEIYKVKGLNKNIPLSELDFKHLLTKSNTIQKSQDKWYKTISKGMIEVKTQLYTLQQTDNKRELLYNSSEELIGTRAYTVKNNELI